MPKRVVDGEALWRSIRLSFVEPVRARPEYANLLPLALANGSFECTPRLVWSQVYSFNRPDITPEDVDAFLKAFEDQGMIFRWSDAAGKAWGYFVGIDKPGRLPGKSRKGKNEKVGAEPPAEELRKFLESKNFPGFGFGFGFGSCIGSGSGEKAGAPKSGAQLAQDKTRPSPSAFTGTHLRVTENQDRLLADAFPWVDRQMEYRKADAWIEANPERRPRKFSRFTHSWFSKIKAPSTRKEPMNADEFAHALQKNSGLVH